MKNFFFGVFLLVGAAHALDVIPPFARGGLAWKQFVRDRPRSRRVRNEGFFSSGSPPGSLDLSSPLPTGTVVAGTYAQVNDHFSGSSAATFNQRYYIDTEAVTDQGSMAIAPIVLYISGEGPMDSYPKGYWTTLGHKQGAIVCTLEHRFYGPEFPEGSKSVHALRLLTVEQALADLRAFLAYVRGRSGSTGPAVIVGGSYSGALSAWFKETYPDDVIAAWSSSGVVNAIVDYVQFDEQIARSAGATCASDLRLAMRAVESDLAAARDAFNATSLTRDTDFLYMVNDGTAMMPQYGHKTLLCGTMRNAVSTGADLVQTLAGLVVEIWGDQFSTGCFYDTDCLRTQTDSPDMARSWRWQKCSQLYYLQAAPATGAIRSSLLTLQALVDQCTEIFGVPAQGVTPSARGFNARYGGADPARADPAVFVDASDDPWQTASVNHTLSTTQPWLYSDCDDCGHCSDLRDPSPADPAPLQRTKASIAGIFAAWFAKGE